MTVLDRFLRWRSGRISNKNFLLLASVFVGLLAGLAAVILKHAVHFIQDLLTSGFRKDYHHYLFFIYPVIGILLTVIYVQVFRKGKLGRGISHILYSISKKSSNVEKDKMHSHIISSALTVGFGGSVGLEAPILVTGSAIGSNVGKKLRLGYREKTILLACGAAAGIAAIFNCPIAAVLFAAEVLLTDFSIPAFIPLLIATATASVISRLLYGGQLFVLITGGWVVNAIPFYIILGIGMGLYSVYFSRVIFRVEKFLSGKKRVYFKALFWGIVLGILVFIVPPLYGEGYGLVQHLMEGKTTHILDNSLFFDRVDDPWFLLILAGGIVLVKPLASAITVGAGGNGGVFAPSLFAGAVGGFFFSQLVNLLGISSLIIPNFIVAGMAGALSAVIHAPLTAIFLIAEITGGYSLFIPLMIVSAISYFIGVYFEPHSIYTKKLIRKGHLASDKDKAVLNRLRLKHLIETDFVTVGPEQSLRELVDVIAHSKRNIFPVINSAGRLVGIIMLDNVREVMFHHELYDSLLVKDLMTQPPASISPSEEMSSVMKKFEDNQAWNLPVIEEGNYIGFVSKSNIFTQYRKLLIKQTEVF